MICLCGHQFIPEPRVRERTSFAVISDAKYGRFLASERKIREASTCEESLTAIAQSARLVGSLRACPVCARLVFVHPGGEKVEYFNREEDQEV